jgi:tetratricopeptide (TPR) repeat protein
MGEIEIGFSRARIRKFILIGSALAAVNCAGVFLPSPLCAQGSDTQSLAALEQKLFFKTYNEENNEARLLRIEKRVFGDQMPGNFQERLSRVLSAASPQINPDGSTTGVQSASQSSPVDPRREEEEKRQAEIERARVATMAAREQAINKSIEEGVALWRAKQSTPALQKFEQALQMDPHNATAHYYIGIVHESRNDYVQALGDYRKASNEDPNNQEYAEAVVAVQKLMNSKPAVSPHQAEINKLAADAAGAYKRGEYLSAMDLYRQLDAKSPNQATVKYNLGSLYLGIKDPQTALEYYRQAVALKPNDPKFQDAYRKLKANVERAEAMDKQTEAAWAAAGYPGGSATGMPPNGMPPMANHGMQGNQMPTQGIASQGIASQGIASQGIASQGIASQGIASSGMPASNMSVGSMSGGVAAGVGPGQLNGMNPSSSGMQGSQGSAMPPQGGAVPPPSWKQHASHPALNAQKSNTHHANSPINSQNSYPNSNYQNNNYANAQPGGYGNGSNGAPPSQADQTMAASNAPPGTYLPQFVPTMPGTGRSPGVHANSGGADSSGMMQHSVGQPMQPHLQPTQPNAAAYDASQPGLNRGSNQERSMPTGSGASKVISKASPFGLPKQSEPNALEQLGIIASSTARGVLITHIGVGSRASKAGLVKGDYIRAVDGRVVNSVSQVMNLLKNKGPDAPCSMHVQRQDQMGTVNL